MNRTTWPYAQTLLPISALLVLSTSLLVGPTTALAAVYYVSTSGSDSNPGTSALPWRNPQKCAGSPVKAGDTCLVRSGTYQDPRGNGQVVYVRSSSAAGTASQPITIKSEKPLGAVIKVPSTGTTRTGFYVSQPYYIIEGFDITGSTSPDGATGISFQPTATGGIARSNSIHHIGRSVCTNTSYAYSGIYISSTSNVVIEGNRFYAIGRRQNGESGCSTTKTNLDHGTYAAATTNLTIRRNVFYDITRGYPIQIYKSSGGTTTNLNIYHNTFSGRNSTGKPVGHVLLANAIKGANIKNNMSHNTPTGMIVPYQLTTSSVTVSYNITDKLIRTQSSIPGITFSTNFENTSNLGLISPSTSDYRLSSTSPAINRGTRSGVPLVPDGSPDAAGYEYGNTSSILSPTGLKAQ